MTGGWYKLLMSRTVTRMWPLVLLAWIGLAVSLRSVAPRWQDIAADGDLAFLPASVPSAVGQSELEKAFPGTLGRSQIVLIFARPESQLQAGDMALAFDLTRRIHWLAAKQAWERYQAVAASAPALTGPVRPSQESIRGSVLADIVRDNLTEAIEIEETLAKYLAKELPQYRLPRLPDAFRIRGTLLQALGEADNAEVDLATAEVIANQALLLDSQLPEWSQTIRDVWSWRSSIVGHKLGKDMEQARLVHLELRSDFTAVSNIEVVQAIEALVAELRQEYQSLIPAGLHVEVGGSAVVGADMLRAAASGVRKTEVVTIVLVLLILVAVYRAPFLVAIPLTSIGLSLFVATSVIALLARDPTDPTSFGLGVFTTTRIFIIVLLFGAGTDFCLFFLARCRELLGEKPTHNRKQMHRLVASGWRSVHDALLASATTTIVGLALMWFSDFQKFRFSGPIIAICLGVTLMVCLTFTPALLSGLGRIAFWPLLRSQPGHDAPLPPTASRYWDQLAKMLSASPRLALMGTITLLALPAVYGVLNIDQVTYDLTEELSAGAASRRGSRLIGRFFPVRDASPATVLLTREEPFPDDDSLQQACQSLSGRLYGDGVDAVRSLTDPLGDYPPGKRMGLFAQDAWRRRMLKGHRITRERYISSVNELSRKVARFDVLLDENPFSLQASQRVAELRQRLESILEDPQSPWFGAQYSLSGTTAGITDLRQVTQADQHRIQVLVTLGVWLVLVLLLRQFVLSTYLIFTVLLSYFTTLGITYWTFSTLYQDQYSGLDWKVPLFLFVILVAVGQDYNVYLVTRIFEERKKASVKHAVAEALRKTGGIITSCGLVMAGTFIAMTSPAILLGLSAWLPAGWIDTSAPVLRGITELGFALALGVLLDTLVVRSILVPCFVLLWASHQRHRHTATGLPSSSGRPPNESP